MGSKPISKHALMLKQSDMFKEFLIAWRRTDSRTEMFQKFHNLDDKAKKLGI